MFARSWLGNLKFGSTRLIVCFDVDTVPPVGFAVWPFGLSMNGILLLLFVLTLIAEKSRPLLVNWFEIHTYGVRPENTPTPPRSCCVPCPTGSQLNPTRGDHCVGAGTTFVARLKSVTVRGFGLGA